MQIRSEVHIPMDKIYPQGTRFALAGRTWETLEVNQKAKVPGISTVVLFVKLVSDYHFLAVFPPSPLHGR